MESSLKNEIVSINQSTGFRVAKFVFGLVLVAGSIYFAVEGEKILNVQYTFQSYLTLICAFVYGGLKINEAIKKSYKIQVSKIKSNALWKIVCGAFLLLAGIAFFMMSNNFVYDIANFEAPCWFSLAGTAALVWGIADMKKYNTQLKILRENMMKGFEDFDAVESDDKDGDKNTDEEVVRLFK